MQRLIRLTPALLLLGAAQPSTESRRWANTAAGVTITRDDWGIAHVHGRTDAAAVFGAIYAQAEDDFPRIEANYLTALGRTSEAEGEGALMADLRQRLFVDPARLQADHARAPAWLRRLTQAWADGLNFYLAGHPQERPRVLTRFEPWMALAFTEGSIGGDIGQIDLRRLAVFYDAASQTAQLDRPHSDEPSGSNGITIAPKLTRDGHAMLLINPHTSFFFRSELQMRSDEGLNAYGASTWGQFFIYQGFNDRIGWMHTTSGVDSVDEFAETVTGQGTRRFYRYGREQRPVTVKPITLRYRTVSGAIATRSFTTYATHHGPITGAVGGKWIATALMNTPVPALEQSWLRTKARSFAEYRRVAERRANSTNNTLYADADGRTALTVPEFVPQRSSSFDHRFPVDGSDPRTDWQGLVPLARLPQVVDPASGWAYNSNDAPWRAAGIASPRAADFPAYLDQFGYNPRTTAATTLLADARALTPESLQGIAYNSWLPLFDSVRPRLANAWARLAKDDPVRRRLAGPVALLRDWDSRWSPDSEATTLANYWAEDFAGLAARAAAPTRSNMFDWIDDRLSDADLLAALDRAVARMTKDWGGWRVKWGEVNRFQRNDAAIVQTFDDRKPSLPVGFASARWGSLASFGARQYPGTRRWYGTSGNSFVAVVQFGPRVKAWAVTAGGESGRPGSRHFTDQAQRYATGNLRPVYFWPDELKDHVERDYRPGT